ncbi:glucosaminidase domain-containing protein [Arcicella lustrica]|uniref:Glucosaminidase domain-containing protein n=1 Tax=Arcicella lustrica TaxID=2984196 RepID=A0ABU5SJQ9_9BACT|nr:glucosaminidase domain-containing protein [Arcicella sp. DC25W]MEA5427535.1 glucosaminidase domain-containing protein [Arcicella sp. DC25W]
MRAKILVYTSLSLLLGLLIQSCHRHTIVKHSSENSDFKVNYKDVVSLGDSAQFQFEAFEKVNQVKVLSDNVVLGTAKFVNKKAIVKIKFATKGEKELVFIGEKDGNKQTKKIKGLVVVVIPQKSIPTPVAKKSVVKSKKVVKPTQPVISDAQIFINEISLYLVERCKKNNLPTSVVIAMAALESGYGKSELAMNANNFFGLKDWTKDRTQAYQYTRQAYAGEIGNWYKKFNSREECFDFFMEELLMHKTGKWRNDYSPSVRTYQENMKKGMEEAEAVEKFMGHLVDLGYTTLPKSQYISRLKKIISTYHIDDLD